MANRANSRLISLPKQVKAINRGNDPVIPVRAIENIYGWLTPSNFYTSHKDGGPRARRSALGVASPFDFSQTT
jgi:hypothetical protein